ncbi:MAG TPA: hypothetical protein VLW85_02605 [Myxococcales bacterium]|nr:hypothetical protein [Myxococcales bacterium]
MVPGVVTLIALSIGRIGLSPHSIANYYRGGEGEMTFPKNFWQLMEVSHFHLFTVPVVALILSHLLYATPASVRARIWLTSMLFSGAIIDATAPWAVRYGAGGFACLLLLGWVLLSAGALLVVAVTLWAMWGPSPLPSGDPLEPE